jgi:zinc protease
VYAHPVMGTEKSVPALTASDVEAFYQQYYLAQNAQIIMVGDLTLAQAKQIANKLSASLPHGVVAQAHQALPATTPTEMIALPYASKQTALVIGQRGMMADDPDRFALTLANYILGGMPLSSVLFDQVREKRGLAYGVSSRFISLKSRGPFLIQLKTRASEAEKAQQLVHRVLQRYIKEGPSAKQLLAAKKNLVGQFFLGLSSNANVLGVVSNMVFQHRPLDYLDHYRARIEAVTMKVLRRALRRVVRPGHMITVSVGPHKQQE